MKNEGLKIKAYYHFVDEFKDVDYEGMESMEEDGVKIIVLQEEELDTFVKNNRFDVRELGDKKVLVRNENIFGQIVKQ